MTNFTFCWGRWAQDNRPSFYFPELRYSLLEFNSRKNWQHLTAWTRKLHEFIFWVTFSSSSPTFWLALLLKIRRRRRQRKRQKSNRKVSRSWNNRDITFSSDVAGGYHRRRRPRIFKRWCYTRRFATTIFCATQRCNIVATLSRIVTTLFQHCNAVLR